MELDEAAANYWAHKQRAQSIDLQREQIAEQRRQGEAQNRIAQELESSQHRALVELERQRLIIEGQRLQIENSEREARRLHAEQIKQLRVLMADTMDSLDRLKKLRPAP